MVGVWHWVSRNTFLWFWFVDVHQITSGFPTKWRISGSHFLGKTHLVRGLWCPICFLCHSFFGRPTPVDKYCSDCHVSWVGSTCSMMKSKNIQKWWEAHPQPILDKANTAFPRTSPKSGSRSGASFLQALVESIFPGGGLQRTWRW